MTAWLGRPAGERRAGRQPRTPDALGAQLGDALCESDRMVAGDLNLVVVIPCDIANN